MNKIKEKETAELKNTGGYKRRIVELFNNSEIEDECSLADVLYKLQFIMDEYKESLIYKNTN